MAKLYGVYICIKYYMAILCTHSCIHTYICHTHTRSALCVSRHLVPLTDLKPVNPVPAWNVAAPTRKGDLGTCH